MTASPPPPPRVDRRLAAVLAADVAGYTRLMGRDEVGTLARLKAHRRELVDPLVAEHHGRVVKLMGDGTLCEFASVVDAVGCAARIQEGLARREAGFPEALRLRLRIGVNLGDVIVEDGGDLYGDGVNVAARLEQMAEPGSILISGTAFDQVENKLPLAFDSLGEQQVKNVDRPVRVYRARPLGEAAGAVRARRWRRPPARLAALGAAAALALAVGLGGVAWWRSDPGAVPSSGAVAAALAPAQDRPSLAVLPLDNLSGDPAQQRLADGLTEDLITELARFRSIAVVARNSTAVYADRPVDVREVGRDLGVRYVLEGSVQTDPERIRITAQLIEAASGHHVWTERYDRPLGRVFEVRDEVVGRIAATVTGYGGPLVAAEREAARRKPPESLQAYDYYLLAKETSQRRRDEAGHAEIRTLLDRALALDPGFARAWAFKAWLHLEDATNGWGGDPAASRRLFHEAAARAVQADPMDAGSHLIAAASHFARGDAALGTAAWDRALALSPNDAHVLLAVGGQMAVALGTERAADGLALVRRSLALNPLQPPWKLNGVGVALYYAGEHREAVEAFGRNPLAHPEARLYLALARGQLGQTDEAAAAAADLLRDRPGFSAEAWIAAGLFAPGGSSAALFADGARKAGLPLCAANGDVGRLAPPSRLPECEAERARAARS